MFLLRTQASINNRTVTGRVSNLWNSALLSVVTDHLFCASALRLWETQKRLRPGCCSRGARTIFLKHKFIHQLRLLEQDTANRVTNSCGGCKSETCSQRGQVPVRARFLARGELPRVVSSRGSSSSKGTSPIVDSTLRSSFKPNYLPVAPANTITLGVRASTYELWKGVCHRHSVLNNLLS